MRRLAWACGQALCKYGLFEASELDFAALAAAKAGVTVLQPQGMKEGKRVGAERTPVGAVVTGRVALGFQLSRCVPN